MLLETGLQRFESRESVELWRHTQKHTGSFCLVSFPEDYHQAHIKWKQKSFCNLFDSKMLVEFELFFSPFYIGIRQGAQRTKHFYIFTSETSWIWSARSRRRKREKFFIFSFSFSLSWCYSGKYYCSSNILFTHDTWFALRKLFSAC